MRKRFTFLDLTENERKGYLFLLVILIVIVFFPLLYRQLRPKPVEDIASYVHLVDALEEMDDRAASGGARTWDGGEKVRHDETFKGELFYFDPNDLPVSAWRRLGFSDKQIAVIKNYENKGGRFYSKSDVAKMYSISKDAFNRIEPYLQFPEPPSKDNLEYKSKRIAADRNRKMLAPIDMNTADTTKLQELRGIGRVFAGRIVKFREALGGFHDILQVREVYGISEELFVSISPFLTLDRTRELEQLKINSATVEELAKHPYITWDNARLIVRYREQHGDFGGIGDLENIYALNTDFLSKIEPYLNFN